MVGDSNRTRCLKGSVTVEASYITVLTVFVIVFMIYTGFYLHDYSVIQSETGYIAEMMTANSFKWLDVDLKKVDRQAEFIHIFDDEWSQAYGQVRPYICEKGRKMIQEKLLICKIDQMDIQCSKISLLHKLKCHVTVTGHMDFPLMLFGIKRMDLISRETIGMTDAIRAIWMKDALTDGSGRDG